MMVFLFSIFIFLSNCEKDQACFCRKDFEIYRSLNNLHKILWVFVKYCKQEYVCCWLGGYTCGFAP